MNDSNKPTSLDTLLMLEVKGEISPEQRAELKDRVAGNLEALDYCRDFLLVSAGLAAPCWEDDAAAETRLTETLTQREAQVQTPRHQIWRSACKIAAMLLMGCVAVFAVMRMLQQSREQGLAQVVNGLAAKWADSSISTAQGAQLAQGPQHLLEGIAQLKMASGARLLVQGPCRFGLTSQNSISLSSGAITANIPAKARGFAVETQDCRIVDYGTEFGVRAQANGQTEVHVFSGRVKLKPSQPAPGQPQEIALEANQAALVQAAQPVKVKAADPAQFMRKLPEKHSKAAPGKWLDLADIVGGGNGFGTGTVGQGINVATGDKIQSEESGSWDQRGAFIMLMDQRYIDGVFSPNSQLGAVTISGTGLEFPECPKSSRCYVGGVFKQLQEGTKAAQGYPVLSHQGNTGITFDLERLRQDNPGVSIQGLNTRCRISRTAQGSGKSMDFWVLVDGKVKAHQQLGPNQREALPINVALSTQARFFTLVTTCPENTQGCWGVFDEPLLKLVQKP